MNRVNFRNDFGHDDSTINIVMAIIIIYTGIGARHCNIATPLWGLTYRITLLPATWQRDIPTFTAAEAGT